MGKVVLHETMKTEEEANKVVAELVSNNKRALAIHVGAMHILNVTVAPETTDEWAVIVEEEEVKK